MNDTNPLEPRWRNFLRLSEQPWIRQHVVQGSVVYPAAGYLAMAIEATRWSVAAKAASAGEGEGSLETEVPENSTY